MNAVFDWRDERAAPAPAMLKWYIVQVSWHIRVRKHCVGVAAVNWQAKTEPASRLPALALLILALLCLVGCSAGSVTVPTSRHEAPSTAPADPCHGPAMRCWPRPTNPRRLLQPQALPQGPPIRPQRRLAHLSLQPPQPARPHRRPRRRVTCPPVWRATPLPRDRLATVRYGQLPGQARVVIGLIAAGGPSLTVRTARSSRTAKACCPARAAATTMNTRSRRRVPGPRGATDHHGRTGRVLLYGRPLREFQAGGAMSQELQLLSGARPAGTTVLPPGPVPPARLPGRQRGWRPFYLDGRQIASKSDFLQACAQALSFPSYFGYNLDALEDSLRDLSWPPAEHGYLVLFDDAGRFAAAAPAISTSRSRSCVRPSLSGSPPTPMAVLLRGAGRKVRDVPRLK